MVTIHRKLSVNLKLFLESMGLECYFSKSDGTWDTIVITNGDTALLEEIKDYVERWGFIPYHFALAPTKKGKKQKDERITFTGKIAQILSFQALQGNFQLILFETRGQGYLWKTYTDSPPQTGTYEVTAKVKANITGVNGEKIALISHCRLKEK